MDLNGAEEGTWGLNGGHAGTKWAHAQQDPMQESAHCLHPVATPHRCESPQNAAAMVQHYSPHNSLKNRHDGTFLGQLRKL